MSANSVQPLRIAKNTQSSSPSKMSSNAAGRPLSEVGPMGVRRNSPSFTQATKGSLLKKDSSPFDSSPFNTSSPRLFWQGRDPVSPGRLSTENRNPFEREAPVSPSKRSSIENLKRASRVKNSSMFAREQKHEYDPSHVAVPERPLAVGRPLSMNVQGNAFGERSLEGLRNDQAQEMKANYEPVKQDAHHSVRTSDATASLPSLSPSKNLASPGKSSLSKGTRANGKSTGFDPEHGIWSDEDDSVADRQLPEGRSLHRHAKSVTFDQAPPQVNEYEMTTPDPSSIASGSREGSYDSTEDYDEESFERGSSLDREDSFDASLEDTAKTPVVLPEDWRFMSPAIANDELASHEEDVFGGEYGSPEPSAQPSTSNDLRPHQSSMTSVDSNGERRPLPPLPSPGTPLFPRDRSDSNNSLSGTVERVSSAQRTLPSPPRPASISKSEIKGMGSGSMSLEDRLKLMMLQEQDKDKSEAEKQRERRMRRAGAREKSPHLDVDNYNESEIDLPPIREGTMDLEPDSPPRISRESILKKIRSQQELDYDDAYNYSSSQPSSSPERNVPLDPDVPIPSVEDSGDIKNEGEVVIKQEPNDEVDVYSIPDLYSQHLGGDNVYGEDDESRYSTEDVSPPQSHSMATAEEDQDTPRAQTPKNSDAENMSNETRRMSLPEFANMLSDNTFDLGLRSYMNPSPPPAHEGSKTKSPVANVGRPITPKEEVHNQYLHDEDTESGTPDSVIRHPLSESPVPDSPMIPEPDATIKAPGGTLKTRPSITPADASSMAAARRQVSGQEEPVPPIPARHRNRLSSGSIERPSSNDSIRDPAVETEKQVKRKSSLVQLEIPKSESDEGLGFGLDKEFDRVIEAQKVAFELSLSHLYTPFHGRFPSFSTEPLEIPQSSTLPGAEPTGQHNCAPNASTFANRSAMRQRGYLMRQNTKVIVASSRTDDEVQAPSTDGREQDPRGTRSTNTSPRKPSQQTWTTEPWNGQVRRKSVKSAGGSPKKKPINGPVPPLPGQQSNVKDGLDSVEEDEVLEDAEEYEDGAERGRLFVKVIGVKDLDLPLPRGERSYFALTLDNGLHCVTTAWLELGRNAPIGQEFELVVLNDLEFQLTLQMKAEEPKVQPVSQALPKAQASPKKPSTFSRVFGSPKKRKELEAKQQETQSKQRPPSPAKTSPYDMVKNLIARDGSFARAYVSLSEHQQHAYGRPYVVDITCFNEWALDEGSNGSRGKKSPNSGFQRRPPYKIGKLELQLLYVPKPKGAKDEDMPKSMNACIREMKEAESMATRQWEGHLSQQGGDCPYWRRRFFRLAGPKLTAYHEATHQPRATINLAKASKLIDDKTALTKKETSTKGGGRRKSAFAEEEEGYMFVEEGFRIRFANGEVIDFYADSAAEKESWMKVLNDTVGKGAGSGSAKAWTDMVLKRERVLAARNEKKAPKATRNQGAPEISPRKSSREAQREQVERVMRGSGVGIPPPVEKSPRHQPVGPQKARMSPMKDVRATREQKARSMIF